MTPDLIRDTFVEALTHLSFGPPVSYVYNPLIYARVPHDRYWRMYGNSPKEVLLVGMNPGPWGMAQTGVPFGEISAVRDWMGIDGPVMAPVNVHPKRPVHGFACRRSEVSGKRLWGWARDTFGDPERFFAGYFVTNYCPLLFVDAEGRNRTPDKLPGAERQPLLRICDQTLQKIVAWFQPRYVIGVGRFARDRIRVALSGLDVQMGGITHPSPANPRANRDWAGLITGELAALGIRI